MRNLMVFWLDKYLNSLTDEDFNQRVTPSGNTGVWILGHLIASDDDLSMYLDKGPMLFPEYQDLFKQGSTLQSAEYYPKVPALRENWKNVCEKNEKIYQSLEDRELDEPHALIQGKIEEDWFKTKEGCLMNWILHQQHHAGQLAVLYSKCTKKRQA